jgi:hypothetical protein
MESFVADDDLVFVEAVFISPALVGLAFVCGAIAVFSEDGLAVLGRIAQGDHGVEALGDHGCLLVTRFAYRSLTVIIKVILAIGKGIF